MIVKKGNKYAVVSKSGKQMGEYDSKAEATKRLKQIEYFKMKAKKSYKAGGKVDPPKKKGMSTAERKERYMNTLKEKQDAEKKALREKNASGLRRSYGSTRLFGPSLEETAKFVSGALDNFEAKQEEKKYKPQREAASKKFDEVTKYDEMLGRATNPYKKYKDGGKVTKKMVDKMDSKMRNEQNATATQLFKELKQGYKMVDGFPRPLTAAQKKDNEKELARTQEKLKKPTSYKYVGTKVPSYSKGGKMMKYLKGGQVKLDANKDGQITGADFMMLRKK